MKDITLAGTRTVKYGKNKSMKLMYYFVEEYRGHNYKNPLYGIRIVKCTKQKGKLVKEQEYTGPVSYSKELVWQMMEKMMGNLVTPYSMLEIVDDFITKELSREGGNIL